MDFATVYAAVSLPATLLGWYALLKYEDRLRERNAGGTKLSPEEDRSGPNRTRRLQTGDYVTRQHARSNGHRPPEQKSGAYISRLLSPRTSSGGDDRAA